MHRSLLTALVFPLSCALLFGCAGNYILSLPATHPASPEAPQAPAHVRSQVLTIQQPTPDPIPPEMKKAKDKHHMHGDS